MDWTVSENTTLTEDKTVDVLTVENGVTLDLNGYKLTCTSLSGSGTITSSATGEDLTNPNGTCAMSSPSTVHGGSVAALFDDEGQTSYSTSHRIILNQNNNKQKLPLIIDYDFGDGNAKVVNAYKIWAAWSQRAPKAWTLYGANRDSAYQASSDDDWVVIDSRSEETSWTQGSSNITPEGHAYSCYNSTAYRYYRLKITAHNGQQYFELVQLEYFSAPPGELHLNVIGGSAAWPSSINFTGNVKVVKKGEGALTTSGNLNIKEGAFVVKNGSVTVGGVMRIGYASGKIAAVDVEGGSLTLNYNGGDGKALVVGGSGTGIFTVNGGTVTVAYKDIYIADVAGSAGTINLNGGTLWVRRLMISNGSSRTLNFNGGTLKAKSAVEQVGLIAKGVTVNVGEKGGTIDSDNLSDAMSGSRVFVAADLGQSGDTGAMTFKGGKTINIEGKVNCRTIVELGTMIVASKKDILDKGFVVDGRSTLEDKDYDILVASGLTVDDLEKVSHVNCASGTEIKLDDNDNPTKIVVSLAATNGVGTDTPVLVFPNTTLQQIKYAKFTARMFGKYVAPEYNVLGGVDGYNTKLYYDNGDLKSVVVEFRYLESGTTRIRCVVVEFTDGEGGVYARTLGARYNANASLGYVFLEQDKKTWHGDDKNVASNLTDTDYGVCDIRWAEGIETDWVLDSDPPANFQCNKYIWNSADKYFLV